MLGFGDFYQIPPIPASASLSIPPLERKSETMGEGFENPYIEERGDAADGALEKKKRKEKSETAKRALNLLWKDGPDSVNLFVELTIQKRIDDPWYNDIMLE